MIRLFAFFLLLTISIGSRLSAQEISDEQKEKASEVTEIGGLPVIFRTPETGLGLGAVVIYTADTTEKKPSPVISGFMLTERKQLLWALGTRQNFEDGRFSLYAYADVARFPQKYFGIGSKTKLKDEEIYEERRGTLDLGGEVRIYRSLSLGLGYTGRQDSNRRFEEGGFFAAGRVPGQAGGHQNGFASSLRWDTSNDNFYPSAGEKIVFTYQRYLAAWASESPFESYRLDAKHYLSLGSEYFLASQLYVQGLNGEPPFYQLAQLGGTDLLRGYFKGRYRDRKLALLQSEWRGAFNASWRYAVFAGLGNVARDWNDFTAAELKPSYGAGLRYQITPKQKINLRLDVGIGNPSEGPQVYLYVMEAI